MIRLKPLSIEEAKIEITRKDDYTENIPPLNVSKITNSNKFTPAHYLEYLPSTCLDWDSGNKELIKLIEESINKRLHDLDFHFELDVNLIRTNGKDSFNLPYTRHNNIYLPEKEHKSDILGHLNEHLIVHEIFHIISRKYPQIRDTVYGLMGFDRIKRFDMLKNLPKYVINPDAVFYDHAITVKYKQDNQFYRAIPVIYFAKPRKNKMKWENLVLLDMDCNPKYIVHRKDTTFGEIVYNTEYLSHPEEISAENFRKWILGEDVPNKALMQAFDETMRGLFN